MKRFFILFFALCMTVCFSSCTDLAEGITTGDENIPPLAENQDPDDPLDGEADGDKEPDQGGDENGNTEEDGENGNADGEEETTKKPGGTLELPKVPLK